MYFIRKYLVALSFILWPLMAIGQEADFEIRNFRERTTDLSAISSNYKDLNGRPAALIRFTVRDSHFEFNANLGVIKLEKKTGEVYLYIPQDTKRLTIRHPRLGVIQDYEIPVKIKSKVTYGADIVITGKVIPEQTPNRVVNREPDDIYSPYQSQPQSQPTTLKRLNAPEFHVYAGLGFNAISAMGPSIHLGASYSNFNIEAGYVLGLDKVENITFTLQNSSSLSEAYDYSCSKFWVRLGYIIGVEKFLVSPQAGVTFNMISGKAASGVFNTTDYFKDSNPMSAFAAVRLSYEVADHLFIHITPQYDFSIGGDEIFEVIKQGDSKIKNWGEGFGINAGIIYEF